MVNGTGIRRLSALPLAGARLSPARVRKSPPFSMDTRASAAPARAPRSALASVADPAVATAAQSQANAGTSNFRQLFSGSPAIPPFVPMFRTATGTDGAQVWGLNHTYFATQETAQWIANRYGTGQVVEVPFGGSGGPFSASANEYHIKLADGRLVNAGILAGYYERNPEALFPGLADKLIRAQIA